jgi:hypothetical protein
VAHGAQYEPHNPRTKTKEPEVSKTPSVAGATASSLIALVVQVAPVAYVAITGRAPVWIRAVFAFWLVTWLLYTVVQGQRNAR